MLKLLFIHLLFIHVFPFVAELLQTSSIRTSNFISIHVVNAAVFAHEEHAFLTLNLNEAHNLAIEHVNALCIFFFAIVLGSFCTFKHLRVLRAFVDWLFTVSENLFVLRLVILARLIFGGKTTWLA